MATIRKRQWGVGDAMKEAWQLSYVDADGSRRSKSFRRKGDAERYRVRVEYEVATGMHIPRSRMKTVAEICDLYLVRMRERTARGMVTVDTLDSVERMISRSILPAIGAMRGEELTAVQVEALYVSMVRDHGLKPETAKARIHRLASVQNFAIEQRLMSVRPVSEALINLRGTRRERVRPFTRAEFAAILAALPYRRRKAHSHSAPRVECLVHIAAFCGLRFGEIMGLTPEAIDFDGGVVHVRQTIARLAGAKGPKTHAGLRAVPMPPGVAVLIRTWMDRHMKLGERRLVFEVDGPFINSDFNRHHWKPLLRHAGLAPAAGEAWHRFHSLRHFAASSMLHQAVPLPDVSRLLGHAKVSTTAEVYTHAMTEAAGRRAFFDSMWGAPVPEVSMIEHDEPFRVLAEVGE